MATNRRYPAGQSVDAEYAFHHWLTLYMQALGSVEPQLKRAGIMEEAPTPGKNYHVPLPPLGTPMTREELAELFPGAKGALSELARMVRQHETAKKDGAA